MRRLRDAADGATQTVDKLTAAIGPAVSLEPAVPTIAYGRFTRDEHDILLVVNVAKESYQGELRVPNGLRWLRLDPSSGAIEPAESTADDRLPVTLKPRQSFLLVGCPATPNH